MSLSIIIVNYKTPQLICDCLDSLKKEIEFGVEIIVVDNNSEDDSRDLISRSYPQIRWIQMGYNSGFARANNEGIRQSLGDIVLLLNSDTVNCENSVLKCWKIFEVSKHVACGVQLLNADLTPQISGNYFMRGGLNNLLPLPYIGEFIRRLGSAVKVAKPHVANADSEVDVDWINGAFLMVKRFAIDRAGLMDEDFFLYAEEAEWCARLKTVGSMVIYGQYHVVHLQGESSNSAFNSSSRGYYNLYDRKGFQIMLSNFVRIRKQFGIGWFSFQLLMYTLTIPVYFICELLAVFWRRRPKISLVGKFSANVFRLWQFSIPIVRNRPYFYKVL